MSLNLAPFEKALLLRKPLLSSEETDCLRLFDGEAEGVPGLVVEKWASVVSLQSFEGKCDLGRADLSQLAQFFIDETESETAYLRDFARNRNKASVTGAECVWGKPQPEVVVKENSLSFLIKPEEKFSVGLFLDQRENRRFLRDRVAGKTVLNLFSYTCAFSVHAAQWGAARVDSVDVSKKYLNWGRANFEHNGLACSEHGFWEDDVRDYLKRAAKRGQTFDQIIIDPPTFARGNKGKVFQVMKDTAGLIEQAKAVLSREGEIFFSSNCAEWSPKTFRALMESQFHQSSFKTLALPKAPLDFPQKPSALKNICVKAN